MHEQNPGNALIVHYPVVAKLPYHLQEALCREGQAVSTEDGVSLFTVGDACHTFVMVTGGAIRVAKSSGSGREIELYRVLPGDSCILTVSCLLGNARYPANGNAEGELTGVSISKALFDEMIAESPAFREFVFAFFAERLTLLMALIEQVAFQRLDARLASVLVRNGPVIHKTHQMLADELGSVREVISRLLKEFESQALVQLDRGWIRVLDPGGLKQIAIPFGDQGH